MITKYYDLFLRSKEKNDGLSPNAIRTLRQTIPHLYKFQNEYKCLGFNDVNRSFYMAFETYFETNGYSESYFGKHIKHLKQFMKWGYEMTPPLHKNKWSLTMKVKRGHCEEEALTSEELKAIWGKRYVPGEIIALIERQNNLDYSVQKRAERFDEFMRNKDFFYALCSTGMYPEDLKNFSISSIDRNGFVSYKRNKRTGLIRQRCHFPFRDDDVFKFKTLCEKYNYNFNYRRDYFYEDIKLLMKYNGIKKIIVPRSARKTNASIWHFERGASQAEVMSILGHTNWASTMHYLKLDTKMLRFEYNNLQVA